uniref:FK506-binding nuclear protein n=1 Tax=Aceria tosichella TaxID=561515 RepID=A0A6G1SAJ6_9ACAR
MFFGQEVKANQNKASAMTMDTDVKLSQAVLDPATKGNKKEPVCLMAEIQGKSFILAVLDPSQSWQCPLDLMLAAGTEVKFFLRGQGTVHLTGYEFLDDDDEDFELSMSSDDEMEEEEDDEQSPDEAESKHLAKKIKTKNSPATTNGVGNKHNAARVKNPPAAKMRASGDDNKMQDSDEDDSDDEDLSFGSGDDDDDDDDDEENDSDMDDVDLDGLSSDDGLDDDDDEQEDEEDDDSD